MSLNFPQTVTWFYKQMYGKNDNLNIVAFSNKVISLISGLEIKKRSLQNVSGQLVTTCKL